MRDEPETQYEVETQPEDESSGEKREEHPSSHTETFLSEEKDHLVVEHVP